MSSVTALEILDAAAVTAWAHAGLATLAAHRGALDTLNVFPVADNDTGTNLHGTWQAVVAALPDDQNSVRRVLAAMTRGALTGGTGNSGTILSQFLHGLATAANDEALDGPALARALTAAAAAMYDAVAEPTEGTMLSVARAAAQAATASTGATAATGATAPAAATGAGGSLTDVARAAAAGAAEGVAASTALLPALARAGVVDAGGRGLQLLLEALVAVVTGGPVDATPPPLVARPSAGGATTVARETGSEEFAFELQFLLDADEPAVDALRGSLGSLGDSLVIVGGSVVSDLWNVHVHVNDVGAAFEAAVAAGRPHRISVTHFGDQVARQQVARQLDAGPERACVAVVEGPGLAALYRSAGVTVVEVGAGQVPTVADVVAAARATRATHVILLPNDDDALPAVRAAADRLRADAPDGESDGSVAVVPTRAGVQGLAAIAVADPQRRLADDVIGMTQAAGACRRAEVVLATGTALSMAGEVAAGDLLGVVEGEVVIVGSDPVDVAAGVVERMLLSGGEIVTVVAGAGADAARLEALLVAAHHTVEVVVVDGGQAAPFRLGVE